MHRGGEPARSDVWKSAGREPGACTFDRGWTGYFLLTVSPKCFMVTSFQFQFFSTLTRRSSSTRSPRKWPRFLRATSLMVAMSSPVSYTHLRAHETRHD